MMMWTGVQMTKPRRKPALRASWGKREQDIVYHYDSKPNGHLLHWALSGGGSEPINLLKELDRRGYDITTLRFSICRKTD